MSLEKVVLVKEDKGFKARDLIVYAVILLLAAVLFTTVFLTRDTNPLKGVKISVDGEAVFTYDFENDEYFKTAENIEIKEINGALFVTVRAHGGYNVFKILKSEREVCVTDSDCRAKTCTYMGVNDNNSVIHCATHHVKAEPLDYDADGGNIPFG